MKNRKLVLFVLWLIISGTVIQAQESVTASGGNILGNDGTVSFSIGQLFYITDSNSSGTIIEGVQQPFEIFVLIKEIEGISLNCAVYPNPTSEFIILKVENYDQEKLTYHLYDNQGKLLQENNVKGNETSISMEDLVPSIYFLTIGNSNHKVNSFKIIKH